MLTCTGAKPPISSWSSKPGRGSLTSWKIDWLVHAPMNALMAIHVGASSQTDALASTRR